MVVQHIRHYERREGEKLFVAYLLKQGASFSNQRQTLLIIALLLYCPPEISQRKGDGPFVAQFPTQS